MADTTEAVDRLTGTIAIVSRAFASHGDVALGTAVEADLRALLSERTALMERLERAERERDEARRIVARCNNSLFGSEGYFTHASGKTAEAAIEDLKEENRRAQAAETKLATLTEAATFLLARIDEMKWGDDLESAFREWAGHVEPAAARLRALSQTQEEKTNG